MAFGRHEDEGVTSQTCDLETRAFIIVLVVAESSDYGQCDFVFQQLFSEQQTRRLCKGHLIHDLLQCHNPKFRKENS